MAKTKTQEKLQAFQVPSTLEGITLLKDGGVSIRFHTNELSTDEISAISKWFQQFGWLLFAASEHDESVLELEQIRKDTGGKSPSQRLRAVIYIEWQQSGEHDLTFEQFYARRMEQMIGYVKRNLKD